MAAFWTFPRGGALRDTLIMQLLIRIRRMADNGDLYLGRYEGWYSVRDEAYYDETELVTGEDASGTPVKLSPQGTPVEWTVEESWFFRLSRYQQPLLDLYARQHKRGGAWMSDFCGRFKRVNGLQIESKWSASVGLHYIF